MQVRINTLNSLDHDEMESNYGPFYRRSIAEEPVEYKSILKKQIQELKDTKIKVYFFETNKSLLFNCEELEYQMNVGSFIQFAIEHYCLYFHNFSPSNIETRTFDLRLDDSQNIRDMLLDPIDQEQKISNFICSTLYLSRRRTQSKIVEKFQSKLSEFLIFEIQIPRLNAQKRNQKLTLQRKPGLVFNNLVTKTFKTCDISQNPKEFILVEYYKFRIFNKNDMIDNISERKFELLKAKQKTFHDRITLKNKTMPEQVVQIKCDNWLFKNVYPTNETSKKQLSAIIDLGVLKGKMKFEIQNCQFVETYEVTMMSKLIEKFFEYPYQIRRSLLALNDAYQSRQHLVLQFISKQDFIIKRYPMSQDLRMNFLEEILRLCRIYKKGIHRKDRY